MKAARPISGFAVQVHDLGRRRQPRSICEVPVVYVCQDCHATTNYPADHDCEMAYRWLEGAPRTAAEARRFAARRKARR